MNSDCLTSEETNIINIVVPKEALNFMEKNCNIIFTNLNPVEKILNLFYAKKKLEELKINNKEDSVEEVEKVNTYFEKEVNFRKIFKLQKKFTLNNFINELANNINPENKNLNQEIQKKRKNYDFNYLIFRGIKELIDEFSQDIILSIDKGQVMKLIYYSYNYIRYNYFNTYQERFDLNLNSNIISYLFEFFNQKPINSKRKEYLSKILDILSNHVSLIFSKFNYDLKFDYSSFEKYFFENFTSNNEINNHDIQKIISEFKESLKQVDFFKNKDNIDCFDLLDYLLQHDLEDDFLKRRFIMNGYDGKFIKSNQDIKSSLYVFIDQLKAYIYLDIKNILINHIDTVLFNYDDIIYYDINLQLINHLAKFSVLEEKNTIENYSNQKSMFIKCLDDILKNVNSLSKQLFNKYFQNSEKFISFLHNFNMITFYIYITLQFIEDTDKILSIKYKYILSLINLEMFNVFTFYDILVVLIKMSKDLPYNIIIILKKLFKEIMAINLFSSKNIDIFTKEKIPDTLVKSYYLYCFDLIHELGNKFEYIINRKEEIFNKLILISNYQNGYILKDNYINMIILLIFAIDSYESLSDKSIPKDNNENNDDNNSNNNSNNKMSNNNNEIHITNSDNKPFNEKNIINEYSKFKKALLEKKSNELLPDINKFFFKEHNNEELNNLHCASIKLIYEVINKQHEKDNKNESNNYKFIPCQYNYRELMFISAMECELVFPNVNKELNKFVSQKRIRMLSPALDEARLKNSPFNQRVFNFNSTSNHNLMMNITSNKTYYPWQKNLNFQFG